MSRNKSNYAHHDILDGDACIYKRHDNGSSFWQFRMWIKDEKMNGIGDIDNEKDELYFKALEIIKLEKKASTSFLQRKLQIGYNRAARIIDMMEAEGIVSKANHVGKRDVL